MGVSAAPARNAADTRAPASGWALSAATSCWAVVGVVSLDDVMVLVADELSTVSKVLAGQIMFPHATDRTAPVPETFVSEFAETRPNQILTQTWCG